MSKKLSVGDRVLCRYYNTPDRKFYGEYWEAVVKEIKEHYPGDKDYNVLVSREFLPDIWLHRKEIKRILK